ncbi:cupredoxin domain-containing protein [Ktedonobacter racemifer]|uniref:Putative blue (Type 1) copper protein n=1 Tax=Ktedonobacter racemifer DSM 44963 TaxID=485913 RepID=D6U5B4_KTERA|nr:plastocyanin/azurin family copper-binding protein [Ktedonobacter racemifer]EFH81694.1 putative blue (type 1) copper protein [Ktedonobacter racemifer DSM 44963]
MFRKCTILLSICSLLLLSIIACSSSTANDTPNTVHMSDNSFVQSSITIKKGDSITLVADTLTPHTIANGTWDNDTAKPSTEAGAPTVKNLQVSGNSSTSIGPFTTAGTFHLYCTIHGGMQLEVIVK